MWGSSGGGIRERRVAKAAVVKPMRPRILEVKQVKEVKEAKDSDGESEAELETELVEKFKGEVEAS